MADHPLRPATDHRLGRPLPHQQANPTRAPPLAINLSRISPAYAVLAEVSLGYPPQEGRFPRATHPCATRGPGEPKPRVRLACVKHAASVRSEPGSNSHVQSQQTHHPNRTAGPSLQARPPHRDQTQRAIKRSRDTLTPPRASQLQEKPYLAARPTALKPPPAHPFFYSKFEIAPALHPRRAIPTNRRETRTAQLESVPKN